jgi:hypothetical protein
VSSSRVGGLCTNRTRRRRVIVERFAGAQVAQQVQVPGPGHRGHRRAPGHGNLDGSGADAPGGRHIDGMTLFGGSVLARFGLPRTLPA